MLLADESDDYFFPLVFDDRAGSIRRKRKLFVLSFTPLTFYAVFSTTSSFVNSEQSNHRLDGARGDQVVSIFASHPNPLATNMSARIYAHL